MLDAAQLVGLEDRAVERADDQRRDADAPRVTHDHARSSALSRTSGSSSRTTRARADHRQQRADARALHDPRAEPLRARLLGRRATRGVCGTNGQNARRPKIVSSAGSSVSIESAAQATPIAPIGPRPEVPFTFAIVRHRSAAITVAAEANTAGPAERHGRLHGLVAVLGVVQLLPVSRHDQERIVGARSEHQDRHDRARLPVDRHAQLGEAVADRAGQHLGEDDRRQRDEQEDRRAVDQDQQDDHERDRGQQQRAVDVLEDLDRVGRVARAAGDLHLEAAARVRDGVAPGVDRVEDPVAVALALQVGGHDRRLAVLASRSGRRRARSRGLARDRRGRARRSPRAAPRRRRRRPGASPAPDRPPPRSPRPGTTPGKRSSVRRRTSSTIFCRSAGVRPDSRR